MSKAHKAKSWVERKLSDPKFRLGFSEAYDRLSIGEQIAQVRRAAGLTQAEVAKRVGTTASAISRYENAEYDRYELRTLRKIVHACGGQVQLILKPPEKRRVA